MSAIPIALCGKHPDMADDFIAHMQPEYEVVHVCHSAPVAISELKALLRNERTEPSSGKGSNCRTLGAVKVPKAIFIGGGFAPSEVDDMRECKELQAVPWLYPSAFKRAASQQVRGNLGPPPMDMIVARAKETMKEKGFVEGKEDESHAGELWEY